MQKSALQFNFPLRFCQGSPPQRVLYLKDCKSLNLLRCIICFQHSISQTNAYTVYSELHVFRLISFLEIGKLCCEHLPFSVRKFINYDVCTRFFLITFITDTFYIHHFITVLCWMSILLRKDSNISHILS